MERFPQARANILIDTSGILGHPRRYYTIKDYPSLGAAHDLHQIATWAAILTASAQILFVVNLVWSWWKGRPAGDNPWNATTLEWTVPSPPPHDNFGGHEPEVHHGPYEFGVPGAAEDFVMQTAPPSAVPASGH